MKKKKPVDDPYKAAAGDDKKVLAVMIEQARIAAMSLAKMERSQVDWWLRGSDAEWGRGCRLQKDFVLHLHLWGAFVGMWLAGATKKTISRKARAIYAHHVRDNYYLSHGGKRQR